MPNYTVVFTTNDALVIKDPVTRLPNALVNPNLVYVRGLDTKYWKLRGAAIVPMTASEQKRRLKHISKNGADHTIRPLYRFKVYALLTHPVLLSTLFTMFALVTTHYVRTLYL